MQPTGAVELKEKSPETFLQLQPPPADGVGGTFNQTFLQLHWAAAGRSRRVGGKVPGNVPSTSLGLSLFVFLSGPLKHKAGTVCLFVFVSGPLKHKAGGAD